MSSRGHLHPAGCVATGRADVQDTASAGQPPTVTTTSSPRTSRAGSLRASSLATAGAPQMIAAVLAALASTQVAAATDTNFQCSLATSPVAGSTMWCRRRFPRRHVRSDVLELARPPEDKLTTCPTASVGADESIETPTGHPPGGVAPATDTSPPMLTRTPESVAEAMLHRATVGGQRFGARSELQTDARRNSHRTTRRVQLHTPPPGRRPRLATQWSGERADLGEVAVITEGLHGSTDCRVHRPARHLRHGAGGCDRLEEERTHPDARATRGIQPPDLRIRPEPAAPRGRSHRARGRASPRPARSDQRDRQRG